jgi:hypothetical protein
MGTCPSYVTVINCPPPHSYSLRAPSWRSTQTRLLSPTNTLSVEHLGNAGRPHAADSRDLPYGTPSRLTKKGP